MGTAVTFQCDECGKTLATEGGFEIHMQSHSRPAPAPLKMASIPEPLEPLTPMELPPVAPLPQAPRPARPPRPARAVPAPPAMLVMGLGIASALIFLVGMTAAVNPSLIRNTKHTTVAATAANSSHSVPIPKVPDSATTPTTTSPGAATSPATTTAPAPAASSSASDTQRVQSLVLQLADYGPGWSIDQSGAGSNDGSDSGTGDVRECGGVISQDHPTTAEAEGPDVVNGDITASTSAASYATESDAAADMATLRDPRALSCLQAAMTKVFVDEGLPASSLSVRASRFSLATGTVENIGLRIVATVTGQARSETVYLDMILLRSGRTGAFLELVCPGDPVPAGVEQALVGRLTQRLQGIRSVSA